MPSQPVAMPKRPAPSGLLQSASSRDTLRSSAQLALHVALPALDHKETRKAGLGVLKACVRGFESPNAREPLGSLLLILARNEFLSGDVAAGRKELGDYVAIADRSLADYGGDYVLYQRKLQLHKVAVEFARAGLWSDALDWLGRFVDAPTYSGGDPSAGEALSLLTRELASKPAKERFAALEAWTLPAPSRQLVRLLAGLDHSDHPPASFRKLQTGTPPTPTSPAGGRLISTATALIGAAAEAGMLDELAGKARAAALKKIENGDVLSLLVDLARGQESAVKGQVETRLAALIQDNAAPSPDRSQPTRGSSPGAQKPRGFPWADYLLARAAIAGKGPDVRNLGMQLLEALVGQAQRYFELGGTGSTAR